MNLSNKRVEHVVSHARTSTESSCVSTEADEIFYDAPADIPIETPLSRPESPLASLGHLGLIRSQRNALQSELRHYQESTADAKKSISSLRKLALRLAVRISVKEADIASHSKALAKARMTQYLIEQQQQYPLGSPHAQPGDDTPISPCQFQGSNKALPALPRPDSPGQTNVVRFIAPWHDTTSIQEVIDDGEDRLIKMDASRVGLKEELDNTRKKLEKLFESQAVLRERYNLEREKSKTLDDESQRAHARIASLEDSKKQIEEETVALHARIKELGDGNAELISALDAAKLSRHNVEEELGKIQSSKLTLEHQLQAAVSSKDAFEDKLSSLKASNAIVNQELQRKLKALEDDSIRGGETVSTLEAAKKELTDELRVANFRLCAAIELEIKVRTQFNQLSKQERALHSDLDSSRSRVSQLEGELQSAHQRIQEMNQSILSLSENLKESEKAKIELEEVTRMALSSREQVETHLREMEQDKAKVDVWLRTTREQLKATETVKIEVETEIRVLRDELAQVQKRNRELETMVEKAETELNVVVEERTATVQHLEEIVAKNNQEREALPEASSDVTNQLDAHQKEIETLHKTNNNLKEKLNIMTREMVELKSVGLSPSDIFTRSTSRFSDMQPSSRLANNRSSSRMTDMRPESPAEIVAAEELYDLEVKQLRETRATFDRVVHSLRNKSTELGLLEKWHDADVEDDLETRRRIPSPVDSIHDSDEIDHELEGIGTTVAAMQPTIVAGHDATSEMGVLETPSAAVVAECDSTSDPGAMGTPPARVLRKSASAGVLRSWKDERMSSSNQNDMLPDGEAILRVGFITSPSMSKSPVSQRPGMSVSPVSQHPGMRYRKELPSRPSPSSVLTSSRSLLDKKLPRIPRRPVGRSRSLDGRAEALPSLRRSRTTSDLKTKDYVWSLFPTTTESRSFDSGRSIIAPKPILIPGPKEWSSEKSRALNDKELPGSPPMTSPSIAQESLVEDWTVRARQLMGAQNSPPAPPPKPKQEIEPPQRHLGLKSSFARLTNLSKKPEGAGHERSISDGGSRMRSLFRRPSKLLRGGENDNTTSQVGISNAVSIQSIPESSPVPIATQPSPSPVGIYDPVTKMWLKAQESPTRTQFGVFDPESRTWMAPGPRSDSLRRVVAVDANTMVGSNPRSSSATDMSYEEEEEGGLSLAEKLEIIRYKPLGRTISTPDTSIEPSTKEMPSVKRTESEESIFTFQTLQLQDRPRPWKPGQLLGLKAPPKDNGLDGTPLDDETLEDFNFTPPFAMHRNNSIDGSGYMSFESEQEARARWKSLMRSVPQMLKKSGHLRHG
ncbi:putative major antigen-like protein [Venturia nashicola]|uniref:Putative major antigen-like protein n=1 Tax=Venturia nashicola TaxID=86259 RepID=A0A4Z1PXL9_9PEZI|nr:putative major antigen-like protein [Venturia nashicola]TLD39711.1 putative major antigen-like protein [Venturia nashicola]